MNPTIGRAYDSPIHSKATGWARLQARMLRSLGLQMDTSGARRPSMKRQYSLPTQQATLGVDDVSLAQDRIKFCHLLCIEYLPTYHFWEVVDVSRRVALVAVLAAFDTANPMQLTIALAIAVAYKWLLTWCKPYARMADNSLSIVSGWSIIVTLFAALLLRFDVVLPWAAAVAVLSLAFVAPLAVCLHTLRRNCHTEYPFSDDDSSPQLSPISPRETDFLCEEASPPSKDTIFPYSEDDAVPRGMIRRTTSLPTESSFTIDCGNENADAELH